MIRTVGILPALLLVAACSGWPPTRPALVIEPGGEFHEVVPAAESSHPVDDLARRVTAIRDELAPVADPLTSGMFSLAVGAGLAGLAVWRHVAGGATKRRLADAENALIETTAAPGPTAVRSTATRRSINRAMRSIDGAS